MQNENQINVPKSGEEYTLVRRVLPIGIVAVYISCQSLQDGTTNQTENTLHLPASLLIAPPTLDRRGKPLVDHGGGGGRGGRDANVDNDN